jgi:Zn-dependent protease with chaperone function
VGVRGATRETLWERVDKSWPRFLLVVGGFAVGAVLLVEVGAVAPVALALRVLTDAAAAKSPDLIGAVLANQLRTAAMLAAPVTTVFAAVYVVVFWSVADNYLRGRFRAELPGADEFPVTRDAMLRMHLASGMATPSLLVIRTPALNAYISGTSPASIVLVVSEGLALKLTADEQAFVFAHLLSRARSGRLQALTTLAALLAPLESMTYATVEGFFSFLDRPLLSRILLFPVLFLGVAAGFGRGFAFIVLGALLVWFLFARIVSRAVFAVLRSLAAKSQGTADDEALLLTKNHLAAASALRAVLAADNFIPWSRSASLLFFAWPCDPRVEESDPELERVARLRDVLGAEGAPVQILGPAAD